MRRAAYSRPGWALRGAKGHHFQGPQSEECGLEQDTAGAPLGQHTDGKQWLLPNQKIRTGLTKMKEAIAEIHEPLCTQMVKSRIN